MQANADKALECRRNADKTITEKGEKWKKNGSPIQLGLIYLSINQMVMGFVFSITESLN